MAISAFLCLTFPQRWKSKGSLGWKRHYCFANKAVLLQSNSRYFPACCLPLLWAVHMPPLIPHRPRGRLGDYPCGSWETQNTSRSILLWLTASNPPEPLHRSACANQSPNRPQTTLQMFCLHNKPQSVINLANRLGFGIDRVQIEVKILSNIM